MEEWIVIEMTPRAAFRAVSALLVLALGALCACATLGSLAGQAGVQRPDARFVGARLAGLSFDKVDLLFDLEIQNPNSMGITMAGFRYDLTVNENQFLEGREDKEVAIAARGTSTIQIPLTLSFNHLYQVFESLRQNDSATYSLKCGFLFDLPVLGAVEIPASKSGDFPLPKIPAVQVEGLHIERLSPLAADLTLKLQLDNSNAFSMILEGMQYQFEINDQTWAAGETGERISITEKNKGLLEIPISLNFLQIGQSVYGILVEGEPLDYQFQGDLDLNVTSSLIGRTHLPFNQSGQIRLLK
jgi:LEA14-like dessication related protein